MSNVVNLNAQKFRVLVVEDDASTRAFFVQAIENHPRLELAHQAANFADAKNWMSLQNAQKSDPPNILLTDLGLPDGNGLDLIRLATQQWAECDSLVISMFGDEDHVLSCIEAGASGYIHKDSAPEDIEQCLIDLKAGASPISPMIARRLLAKYRDLSAEKLKNNDFSMPNQQKINAEPAQTAIEIEASNQATQNLLSKREIEILDYLSRGFTYAEVGDLKHLSVYTIQSHVKNIYAKLSVHNRSEAVFEATRLGLLKAN